MTIKEVSTILGVPIERAQQIAQAQGICCSPEEPLSEQQMHTLRTFLLRTNIFTDRPAAKPQHRHETVRTVSHTSEKPQFEVWDGPVEPHMEKLVLEKKIVIDTCSLMHDKCEILIRSLLPALQKHKQRILIPERVIGELRKHQKCVSDPEKAAKANQGMRLCRMLQKAGCITIRGADQDNFADNTLYVALSHYRYQYHMLLVTQDRGLSADILGLNRTRSTAGHPIEVMYINSKGVLCPFREGPGRSARGDGERPDRGYR